VKYTISPSAWGAAFPVPAAVVDKHLKLAGAAQLKALLWLLRHSGEAADEAQIAKAIGQQKADTVDALHYWVECGILIAENTVDDVMPDSGINHTAQPASAVDCVHPQAPAAALPVLPAVRPSPEQVAARCAESKDIRYLFNEAQVKMGRTIGYDGQCTLLMLHDQYGLPVEVILMMIEYCVSSGVFSFSYIAKVGKDWGEKEIFDIVKADAVITALKNANTAWRKFAAQAHLNASPTSAQLKYIGIWTDEFGFDTDIIYIAYEEMANHCRSLSFPYMHKVLGNWHTADIKTADQALKALADKQGARQNGARAKEPPSYDLDTFKRKSKEPPVYKKKEK